MAFVVYGDSPTPCFLRLDSIPNLNFLSWTTSNRNSNLTIWPFDLCWNKFKRALNWTEFCVTGSVSNKPWPKRWIFLTNFWEAFASSDRHLAASILAMCLPAVGSQICWTKLWIWLVWTINLKYINHSYFNLVKSNKSFFSWNCIFGSFPQFKKWFLAIFEIAKNRIWPKNFFREIHLFDFTSFWPGRF